MSKTSRKTNVSAVMRPEYEFDYRRSRPNRFTSQMTGDVVAVVLEPDVAQVFDTSDSVNRLLRSVISAIPDRERQTPTPKRTKKRANKRMEPTRAGS